MFRGARPRTLRRTSPRAPITAVVILWTYFKVSAIGAQSIPWPNLDKAVSITLYKDKVYAAIWAFQPLATGTAINSAWVP